MTELLKSEIAQEIIEALQTSESYPSNIAEQIDRNRSNVSNYLNEMERLDLVESEKKGQANHYSLTDKGEEFLRRVSELEEEKEELMEWLYQDSETS